MTIDVYHEIYKTDRYVNTKELPSRPKKPPVPSSENPEHFIEYADELQVYLIAKDEFNKAMEDYKAEERRILEQFRKDLAEEFDVVGHPKEHLLWERAWVEGHSIGFSEVYNEYAELAELVN